MTAGLVQETYLTLYLTVFAANEIRSQKSFGIIAIRAVGSGCGLARPVRTTFPEQLVAQQALAADLFSRTGTDGTPILLLMLGSESQLHGKEKQGYRRRQEATAQGLNNRQGQEYQNQY